MAPLPRRCLPTPRPSGSWITPGSSSDYLWIIYDPWWIGLLPRLNTGVYKIEANTPNIYVFFGWWRQTGMASLKLFRRFVSSVSKAFVKLLPRRLLLLLLLIGCVHPNPGPRPPPPRRIISWNCNGIGNSAAEFNNFLNQNNVVVACVQESKLGDKSRCPKFPGFTVIRRDRAGGGGGLLTLVHHSLNYQELQSPLNDGVTESLVVNVSIAGSNLNIVNLYVPPASSTPANFRASIAPFLTADSIVLGDVNAHNDEWSQGTADVRGDSIAAEIDANNFVVMNNSDLSTRPSSASSPDIALVHSPLALQFDWSTSTTLNSDHLPVSLSFADETAPIRGKRSYINFHKANWDGFKRDSEELFSSLRPPKSCAVGEKEWRRVLQKCSARNIPAGYHRVYAFTVSTPLPPHLSPKEISSVVETQMIRN